MGTSILESAANPVAGPRHSDRTGASRPETALGSVALRLDWAPAEPEWRRNPRGVGTSDGDRNAATRWEGPAGGSEPCR